MRSADGLNLVTAAVLAVEQLDYAEILMILMLLTATAAIHENGWK